MIDYDALTSEIMDGMKDKPESGIFSHIIKTEIGDSVLGRFLIHKENPKESMHHYMHHGWKTNSGEYVSYRCPSLEGKKCPICAKSIQFWKSDDPFLKEQSKKIRRKENWISKFYVIENLKNPKMNNQLKLFRFGKQVNSIVQDALNGEDKEIFGKNIWRLDEKGCNFRITVKPNSDSRDAWPSYSSSKFLPPSEIDLTDEQIMELLNDPLDHTKIFEEQLSYDELLEALQVNFLDELQEIAEEEEDYTLGLKNTTGKKSSSKAKTTTSESKEVKTEQVVETVEDADDVMDELDMGDSDDNSEASDEIDELLAELDD